MKARSSLRSDLQRARSVARLIAPYWRPLVVAIFLFLAGRGAMLTVPLVSARIIDRILPAADRSGLGRLLLVVVALTLLAITASLLKDVVVSRVTNSLLVGLRGRMQELLHRLPVQTLQRWKPGYWMSRLDGDVTSISMLSGEMIVSLFEDVISIALAGALIVYTSAHLSTLLLFFAPLLVASSVVLSRKMAELARRNRERWGVYLGYLEDEIRSSLLVKSLGVERRRSTRGRRLLSLAGRADLGLVLRYRIISGATGIVALMLPVAVLWFGILAVMDGELSLGRFVAFNTYLGYITAPINRIVSMFRQFRVASVSFDRVQEVLSLPVENDGSRQAIGSFEAAIELERVIVRYEDGRVALRGVDAVIPKGHHVALVGPNGSGKSTLLRTIQAYCTPAAGCVRIDGMDLASIDPASLRRIFGYLPAGGGLLLDGTLEENLTFGAADPSELPRILEEVAFFDGTGMTPIDLRRRVSEIGARLSDGQRQLLALVRLLLRKPQIAVIDEGMSFLDGINQQRVLDVLRRRLRDTTVLWATHGYDQIEEFDDVMVLTAGCVESYGSLTTALAKSTWFRNVFTAEREATHVA